MLRTRLRGLGLRVYPKPYIQHELCIRASLSQWRQLLTLPVPGKVLPLELVDPSWPPRRNMGNPARWTHVGFRVQGKPKPERPSNVGGPEYLPILFWGFLSIFMGIIYLKTLF